MLSTKSGWLGKVEVVELTYDPAVVSYERLTKLAVQNSCASSAFPMNAAEMKIAQKHYGDRAAMFSGKVRVVKDTKYYLKRTPLQYVPMTEAQASRVNGNVQGAEAWLSPSQLRFLATIKKHPDARWKSVVGEPLSTAWSQVAAKAAKLGQ